MVSFALALDLNMCFTKQQLFSGRRTESVVELSKTQRYGSQAKALLPTCQTLSNFS